MTAPGVRTVKSRVESISQRSANYRDAGSAAKEPLTRVGVEKGRTLKAAR
jgi:hypothetical protein